MDTHPKRCVEEIYKMNENTNAELEINETELIWNERINTNFGLPYFLRIHSGAFYPYQAPKVYAFDENSEPFSADHQYKDGSLCLFEPKEYHSNISILEIRNMACSWLFSYEGKILTGEWLGAEADHSPLEPEGSHE